MIFRANLLVAWLAIATLIFWSVSSTQAQLSVQVIPEEIQLHTFQPEQIVSVRELSAGKTFSKSLTKDSGLTLKLQDPQIAELIEHADGTWILRAKGNGTTNLQAFVKSPQGIEVQVQARVSVALTKGIVDWEFENHVQPILSRNGCNMGACHGALAGKGGFRLSLRGYDPISDHFNIVKQDNARRVELAQPESSLILLKPTGLVEHKGGVRLQTDSIDYRILLDWISAGAPAVKPTDPKLESIELLPDAVALRPTDRDQLTLIAHYSNGRKEDVTRWAKFSSSDESVALVDAQGRVQIVGPGEGTIVAWFSSRIASSRIRVPFDTDATPGLSLAAIQEKLGMANPIDQHIASQLAALRIAPSDRCTDEEFLRRSSLDATGSLPTVDQIEQFLADSSPDKRSRWIESLLSSPQFVDYWAYRWSDVLMLNSNLLRSDGVKAYYQWIRQSVEQNKPWDAMVREILTATGNSLDNGATNFYGINQDPETMTENACQAFLGLSIGCAKCHNHPLEKWTNDQYYAMANLFARVRAKGWGGEVRNGDSARTVFVVERGDLIQPLRGKPQPPAPLDAPAIDSESTEDRRIVLAQWMTSPNNPYFTRATVNRIWAAYFGIGIVNAVDDLRASNPESNPALMAYLSQYLIENRYDLKSLMRQIMNSETYQRSSNPRDGNQADRKHFSHYYPKRLMAEVIHDAIASVTAVPSEFNKIVFLGGDRNDTKFYPKGTKAIQLFDSSVESNFLKTFGRNQRRITCECERSDEPSIVQALHLANGETLNNKLAQEGGIVDQLLERFPQDNAALVRAAYLRTICREPTASQQQAIVQELERNSQDRHVAIEDLLWSLMSSREFLFNY
jgi:hypothetical protein